MSQTQVPFSATEGADLAAARIVKRVLAQWWLVGLCVVIAGAAAYAAANHQKKEYSATATIQVGTIDLVSIFLAQDVQVSGDDTDPDRLTAAAVAQFDLPDVRDRAVRALNRTVTSQQIAKELTVSQVTGSSVLNVSVRDRDPGRARIIANAMVAAFIAQRVEATRAKLITAKTQVTQQYNNLSPKDQASSTGQILQDRLKEVGVVGALSNGNVDVIQGARTPVTPVAPRPKREASLGAAAGLLIGLAIALLRARLDDRIRDTAELAEIWELPIVGSVPQSGAFRHGGRGLPDPAGLEALSLARTNLRYLKVGGDVKTVLLTSALASEGKSTISWNLAIAAALAKSRTLVIEADLRRPKITERLGLSGAGLSEVLAGLAPIDEAISTIEITSSDSTVATTVDVIPAGMVPPSPVALLEDSATKTLLSTLRERYDVILIDTPPATVVADAVAIVDEVDGVVVVSRLGTVRRGALKRMRQILESVNAPVLGQIVNSESSAKGYGYYAEAYSSRKRDSRRKRKQADAAKA